MNDIVISTFIVSYIENIKNIKWFFIINYIQ